MDSNGSEGIPNERVALIAQPDAHTDTELSNAA